MGTVTTNIEMTSDFKLNILAIVFFLSIFDKGGSVDGSIDGKMDNERKSNDWEISSISKHPDFTSLKLRETNNGSDLIKGESKDQIIINLTNNFVENKEEISQGTLMAKVSISTLLLVITVIVFEFQ